jgi:hypothetical protein
MRFSLLKRWISMILEQEVLGEPDLSNQDDRDKDKDKEKEKDKDNKLEMSAGGVAGVSTPLGTGPTYPDKIRKKAKRRNKRK